MSARLQQERGQAHWALLCDPAQVPLRLLYDRLVLNLPRLPRTALAHQLNGADALRGVLDNPRLDESLDSVFGPAQAAERQAAASAAQPAPPTPDVPRRPLEVVPPGWHGQV